MSGVRDVLLPGIAMCMKVAGPPPSGGLGEEMRTKRENVRPVSADKPQARGCANRSFDMKPQLLPRMGGIRVVRLFGAIH